MSDPAELSLGALSRLLREGAVSPETALEACLARVDARDEELNAFLTVDREGARSAARAAGVELSAGRWRGPLHGVPLAVKDLFLTAGIRTTAGSALLRDWVPDEDATVVRLLRQAGAVIVGKTHLHEFAYGATNHNETFGPCRNPHDTARISGGSSGGSAVAVTTGMCFAALGSDTGGSIRIPAALCGCVGIKPTYGRVSRRGVIPLAWTLDHVGPLTRTVEDAALVLEAIAGVDPQDPGSVARPVPCWSRTVDGPLDGVRIGVPESTFWSPVDPQVREACEQGMAALEAAGAVRVSLPGIDFDVAAVTHGVTVMAEASAYHLERIRSRCREYGRRVRLRLLEGLLLDGVDYLAAQRARVLVQRAVAGWFEQADLVAGPTVVAPAPRIDDELVTVEGVTAAVQGLMVRNTFLWNLTGHPAISVPCGRTAAGLPVGLQLAARPWREDLLFQAGRRLEEAGYSASSENL